MQCLKSQTFSDSCAQNCHDLLAKIGEHIDGTSGAERGCNMDWTLTQLPKRYLVVSKNDLFYIYLNSSAPLSLFIPELFK